MKKVIHKNYQKVINFIQLNLTLIYFYTDYNQDIINYYQLIYIINQNLKFQQVFYFTYSLQVFYYTFNILIIQIIYIIIIIFISFFKFYYNIFNYI